MTGNPRPKVTWNVRGTTIRDDNDKYQVTSEGLVIKNITQNDKGAYKCNARQLDEDIADFQDMIIQLLIEREYILEYELFFTEICSHSGHKWFISFKETFSIKLKAPLK